MAPPLPPPPPVAAVWERIRATVAQPIRVWLAWLGWLRAPRADAGPGADVAWKGRAACLVGLDGRADAQRRAVANLVVLHGRVGTLACLQPRPTCHTRTYARAHTLPPSLSPSHNRPSLPPSLRHTHSHTFTHSLTLTHSHSLEQARTHARTHACTHALTHACTLSPSCPPTDALSRPPSLPPTLLPTRPSLAQLQQRTLERQPYERDTHAYAHTGAGACRHAPPCLHLDGLEPKPPRRERLRKRLAAALACANLPTRTGGIAASLSRCGRALACVRGRVGGCALKGSRPD